MLRRATRLVTELSIKQADASLLTLVPKLVKFLEGLLPRRVVLGLRAVSHTILRCAFHLTSGRAQLCGNLILEALQLAGKLAEIVTRLSSTVDTLLTPWTPRPQDTPGHARTLG